MRTVITDKQWAVTGPLVDQARMNRQGAKPVRPDRRFFEALLYHARTEVAWRDLPGEFGAWDAVSNRYRRWDHSGSLAALFAALTAHPAASGVGRVLIDATTVRAHQHAAGSRRRKEGSGRRPRPVARASAAAAAG